MSVYQSCLLLLVATVGGWLIHSAYLKFIFWPNSRKQFLGISFQGILPRHQPQLAKLVAAGIANKYLNAAFIQEKAKYDLLALQLKPQIERHVDAFLKEKLPPAFPMLFNLMGEKTLLKFKAIFMDEVESVLPVVMKDAVNSLLKSLDMETNIEKTLREIPMANVEKAFRKRADREMTRFKWLGAAAGFVIGLVQILMLIILT